MIMSQKVVLVVMKLEKYNKKNLFEKIAWLIKKKTIDNNLIILHLV